MSKDPAFLFYSSDFLSGVSDLTLEERGQYITLLCLHHQKGRLTEKMIRLSVGNATADVMAKFRQDENGMFFNERLEAEIEKRKIHAEKQRVRAIDGWKKRKHGNATAYATAMPLENENENENENINENISVTVTSEKNKNQFPDMETIQAMQLNEMEVERVGVYCGQKITDYLRHWQTFSAKFDGSKFYQDRGAIISYFMNWLKSELQKQKKPLKQTTEDKWAEWEKRKGIKS
jgi:uncharacterized protein YdaU (DUF1376 family)